jgi:hypothetical protein
MYVSRYKRVKPSSLIVYLLQMDNNSSMHEFDDVSAKTHFKKFTEAVLGSSTVSVCRVLFGYSNSR